MRAERAFFVRSPWNLVSIVVRQLRTFDILWQKCFPRAKRAEISGKVKKIWKMRAERAFFIRLPWKLVSIVVGPLQTFDVLWQKCFPRAQRAEISVKVEKIGKMRAGRAFCVQFPWNLVSIVVRPLRIFDILQNSADFLRAARGNQRQRCKIGQKCMQSAHFCFNSNGTWYTWPPSHCIHMVFYDNARSTRNSLPKVQNWAKIRAA